MPPQSPAKRLPFQFWIITSIAFINSVSFTIIIPTLYPYAKQFGLSDFEASLLTTAYSLSQFLGTPILGQLSDRWGRKPLLVVSLLGTVVSNLVAAYAGVPWLLFGARILDGITGGNNSVAQAVISDITSPEQRTQAFGIYSGLFRLGFVAGPPLSYVAQTVPPIPGVSSLGMSFLVSAAIALIAAILCFFFLSETKAEDTEENTAGFKKLDFVGLFTALRRPVVGRILLMTFLNGFTFTIFTFAFQPFFLNVLGQDAKNLAIAFVAFGHFGLCLSGLCSRAAAPALQHRECARRSPDRSGNFIHANARPAQHCCFLPLAGPVWASQRFPNAADRLHFVHPQQSASAGRSLGSQRLLLEHV